MKKEAQKYKAFPSSNCSCPAKGVRGAHKQYGGNPHFPQGLKAVKELTNLSDSSMKESIREETHCTASHLSERSNKFLET